MRTAIFGGSFDPVHAEHVCVVRAAKEKLGLDRIFVVPALSAPHKDGCAASAEDRLAMCRLAFSSEAGCEVSPYEIRAEGTSYTYRTAEYFRARYPGDDLFLLTGADMLGSFHTWKEPEKILSCARLAVCGREGQEITLSGERKRFFKRFGTDFVPVGYTGRDVSSSRIRVLCAFGGDTGGLLSPEVREYIDARALYSIPHIRDAMRYLKPARAKHSLRVAFLAAELARKNHVPERDAVQAAALHDAAKYLSAESPELAGFRLGEPVPPSVLHQYTGAYLAEHTFGVTDPDILNAIRYHTTGRPGMSKLEEIIYLADMLEEGRDFPGVVKLRRCLSAESLDESMYRCLKHQTAYLGGEKETVSPLTAQAYEYYSNLHKANKN